MTKPGDAGGLLKNLPPVAALDGQNLIDTALTDDGVALPSKARVHEQLVDVPEAYGLLIDEIFALAAAVVTAGDHHLGLLDVGEDVGTVVQHQGDLGEAHRAALLGAAEDHILHLHTSEIFGALLPHHPADSVGNIGFPGAVGSHDGGNLLPEVEGGLIGKGLEALNVQRL